MAIGFQQTYGADMIARPPRWIATLDAPGLIIVANRACRRASTTVAEHVADFRLR